MAFTAWWLLKHPRPGPSGTWRPRSIGTDEGREGGGYREEGVKLGKGWGGIREHDTLGFFFFFLFFFFGVRGEGRQGGWLVAGINSGR